MIGIEQLKQAIDEISAIAGIEFDSDSLVEDVLVLSYAFTKPEEYDEAIRATVRALRLLANERAASSILTDDYEGWCSFHYQHQVYQGAKADMCIMFRRTGDAVQVRGFGHRRMPADFYRRMSDAGRA